MIPNMIPAQWKEESIISAWMCHAIYWSKSDTATANSNFDLWDLKSAPKSLLGWEVHHEQNLLPSGEKKWDSEYHGSVWKQGVNQHTVHQSFIPAEDSGSSRWYVQPCLRLEGKLRAPLYELEQSEGNYQLNLRMNRGSQTVPHSSCSAALYIILREPYARIMLHSERGDCFT